MNGLISDAVPERRGPSAVRVALAVVASLAFIGGAAMAQVPTRAETESALKKAATYFRNHAASHGGYVYYVSEDLTQRWGEGGATPDQIFVQPPGTPAVGMTYLKAYAATQDRFYLQAANDAAQALLYGQLKSGGWTQKIDFNPEGSYVALYRNGKGKGRNHTSLDDNQTQAAIGFLVEMDRVLQFKDEAIHEAVRYALDALLKAQFPNGAFPQGFTGPVAPHPVVKASYPAAWPRTWPNQNYWDYYTLNDGLAGTVSATLLQAFAVYKESRYRDAVARLGDFLILAQMPDPQPAWAQQYSYEMQPMWARKFEPPAICGLESEDAVRTLLRVHRVTGDAKYLRPIPRALAYLKSCRLPDGRMARYYELQTNRPLYMNRRNGNYFLTYDDTNLPPHYGWKQPTAVDELAQELADVREGKISVPPKPAAAELAPQVRAILAGLDDQGRWMTTYAGNRGGHDLVGQPTFKPGFRFISSTVFNGNVETLSQYLNAMHSN
jgi:hypothetical protein